MSFSPTLQEVTQGASERGARFRLLENAQDSTATKQDSNVCHSCANSEAAEAYVPSHPSDTGLSVCPTDSSNAATSSENTVGYTGEEANRGFTEAPSNLEQASIHKNVEYGLNMDSVGLHEAHVSSQPPDTCFDSAIDSNIRFSYNSTEVAVSPIENGVCLKNVFDGESKGLGLHTSMGVSENFADFCKQQLLNQESGVAVVVSTELDGWQRFDAEENEGNHVFCCDQASDGNSLQKRDLWEQLLEEGSEVSETHFRMSTSQVEAETAIDSAFYGVSQFWLASPGNPFIEGLDRLSNFSEADHCNANDFIAKSQLLDSFEADMGLQIKEGTFHTDRNSDNFLQDELVQGNLGSLSNGLYDHENSGHAKPRYPSFSDIRQSSSKSRDTSFASCMEAVPALQAGDYVQGIDNDGEKWVANFDLMVPEGPRSLSLPREAGETQRQRQKQSFSLFSREALVTSQSKLPGFSSPKLSPKVRKVVNKVWTKPEVGVNAVHHEKSSNAMDKKPKKWIWRCCICCSHVN